MIHKSDFVSWLLEAQTPSIRYLALRDLLEVPAGDERLSGTRQAIMNDGPIPAILARQTETGEWGGDRSYYTPKYTSSHWSMLLLRELETDPQDARFQRGAAFMLDRLQEGLQKALDEDQRGWSCFWGNLLHYAVYAGKGDDPRVQMLVDYAVRDLSDEHCRCRYNDGHACAWGVVRTLWGLAALRPAQRTPAVQAAIDHALPFLLEQFSLLDANYPMPDNGKINPLWFTLNFPLFYQADILFTLRVLAQLGALSHPGAQPALDWLEARRAKNGRWKGSSPYRGRTWRALGDHEETDRWASLHAALILKQAGRLAVEAA